MTAANPTGELGGQVPSPPDMAMPTTQAVTPTPMPTQAGPSFSTVRSSGILSITSNQAFEIGVSSSFDPSTSNLLPNTSIAITSDSDHPDKSKEVLWGCVVGGLTFLSGLAMGLFIYRRKNNSSKKAAAQTIEVNSDPKSTGSNALAYEVEYKISRVAEDIPVGLNEPGDERPPTSFEVSEPIDDGGDFLICEAAFIHLPALAAHSPPAQTIEVNSDPKSTGSNLIANQVEYKILRVAEDIPVGLNEPGDERPPTSFEVSEPIHDGGDFLICEAAFIHLPAPAAHSPQEAASIAVQSHTVTCIHAATEAAPTYSAHEPHMEVLPIILVQKRFFPRDVSESTASNLIADEVKDKLIGDAEDKSVGLSIPGDQKWPKKNEIPAAALIGEVALNHLPLATWAAQYTREAASKTGYDQLGRGEEHLTVTDFSRTANQLGNNRQAARPLQSLPEDLLSGERDDYDATKILDYFRGDDNLHRYSIPYQNVQSLQVQPRIAMNVGSTLALQVIPSPQHWQQPQQQQLIFMQQQPVVQLAIRQVQVQQHVQLAPRQRQLQQVQMVPAQGMQMVQVEQPVQRQVRITDLNTFVDKTLILIIFYGSLR
jgi:hypothetical protein